MRILFFLLAAVLSGCVAMEDMGTNSPSNPTVEQHGESSMPMPASQTPEAIRYEARKLHESTVTAGPQPASLAVVLPEGARDVHAKLFMDRYAATALKVSLSGCGEREDAGSHVGSGSATSFALCEAASGGNQTLKLSVETGYVEGTLSLWAQVPV